MRTENNARYATRLRSLVVVGVFMVVAAAVAVPFYSVRSSSSPALDSRRGLDEQSVIKPDQILSASISRGISLPLLMPQATPTPSIATFDGTGGNCGAAKVEFNLGQQVCA